MHKLPTVVFLAALWLALAAGPLYAQAVVFCDPTWRTNANGEVRNGVYIVDGKAGEPDTLASIGKRFCVSVDALVKENRIVNRNLIYPGQQIRIPGLVTGPVSPCPQPFLTISVPAPGAPVGASFTVSGSGCGLLNDNVTVYAWDEYQYAPGAIANVIALAQAKISGANQGVGAYSALMQLRTVRGNTVTLQAVSGDVKSAPVTVSYAQPATCMLPTYVVITEAKVVSTVPTQIFVSGQAGSNCQVTVTATPSNGSASVPLARQAAGTGAGTYWSATLQLPSSSFGGVVTINAHAQAGQAVPVNVVVVSGGTLAGNYRDLDAQACTLGVRYGTTVLYTYTNPDGQPVRALAAGERLAARRLVPVGGKAWYAVRSPQANWPDEWVLGDAVEKDGPCW